MLNKLERKFGKYAIPHLIVYLIGGYALGYLLQIGGMITNVNFIRFMTLEPYYIIHGFQFWRLITWVMIPPSNGILFVLIMMLFYYQLGTVLEHTWGTFRFNVYMFGGIIATIIGAFVLYFIYGLIGIPHAVGIGNYFTTYYINMSIFLAFAVCYPDMEVRLYFLIPIKMKWMAVVYAVLVLIDVIGSGWGGRVAIICSLLNFVVFYLATRDYRRVSPKEMHRKQAFRRAMNGGAGYGGGGGNRAGYGSGNGRGYGPGNGRPGSGPIARHKCAICGRTELTNPELEFRFCSKCNGNYEYCQDHLFTHTHVK